MSRWNSLDSSKQSVRIWRPEEGKELVQRFRIQGRTNQPGCQDRFYLRRKNKCAWSVVTWKNVSVIEWLDADVVTGQREFSFMLVPNCESKHAVQTLETIKTPFSKRSQQNFSIAISSKLLTTRAQLFT